MVSDEDTRFRDAVAAVYRSKMGMRGGLVVLVLLAGCSFVGVRSSPHRAPQTARPSCSSRAVPTLDLIAAPLWVGLAAATVLGRHGDTDAVAGTTELAMAGTMVAISVTSLASSIYGYVAISSCHGKLDSALTHSQSGAAGP